MTKTDPAAGLANSGGCLVPRLLNGDDPDCPDCWPDDTVPLAEVARSLRERVLAALGVRE